MHIPINKARVCLNCDSLHDERICPICTSDNWFPLSRWLPSLDLASNIVSPDWCQLIELERMYRMPVKRQ